VQPKQPTGRSPDMILAMSMDSSINAFSLMNILALISDRTNSKGDKLMFIISPKKIKPKGDTIQMFLADQDKFKPFYRDFVLTSKAFSTHASRKDTRVTQDMRPQRISRMAGLSPVSSLQSFLLPAWTGLTRSARGSENHAAGSISMRMRNFVAPHG
jgi:hypothetical protein